MGAFSVEVHVRPVRGDTDRAIPVKCLVDTGAAFCQFPATLLASLGVTPDRRVSVVLANGTRRDQPAGWVEVRYGDRVAFTLVLFGGESDLTLLGADALEGLGLAVDPVRRILEPTRFPLALTARCSARLGRARPWRAATQASVTPRGPPQISSPGRPDTPSPEPIRFGEDPELPLAEEPDATRACPAPSRRQCVGSPTATREAIRALLDPGPGITQKTRACGAAGRLRSQQPGSGSCLCIGVYL